MNKTNIMECPNDTTYLEKMLFHNVEVEYCPQCLGVWFDKDELNWAKNDKDEKMNWLDFDIWRDKAKFKFLRGIKHCPLDRAGLVQVAYDKSNVTIDFCKMCQGVWLDRGEFKNMMAYMKDKSDYEVLHRYTKNLAKELWEVFSGPEPFREEVLDFMMVLKLLNYKFVTQHPLLNSWIENSQK